MGPATEAALKGWGLGQVQESMPRNPAESRLHPLRFNDLP